MARHNTLTAFALSSLMACVALAPAQAFNPLKLLDDAAGQAAKNTPDVNINPRLRPDANPNVGTPRANTPNVGNPNVARPNIGTPDVNPGAVRNGQPNVRPDLAQPNVRAQTTQPNAHQRLPYDFVPEQPRVNYDRALPENPRPLPATPNDVDAPPNYTGLATRERDQLDDFFEVRRTGIDPDARNLNNRVGTAPDGNDALAGQRPEFLRRYGQQNANQPRWDGVGNPYAGRTPVRSVQPLPDQRLNVPTPKRTPGQIAKQGAKYGAITVVGLGAVAGAGYGITVGVPAFIEWVEDEGSGQVSADEGVPLIYPDDNDPNTVAQQ